MLIIRVFQDFCSRICLRVWSRCLFKMFVCSRCFFKTFVGNVCLRLVCSKTKVLKKSLEQIFLTRIFWCSNLSSIDQDVCWRLLFKPFLSHLIQTFVQDSCPRHSLETFVQKKSGMRSLSKTSWMSKSLEKMSRTNISNKRLNKHF